MFKKLRRHFPDREQAGYWLTWLPVGKSIKVWYGKFRYEYVIMTPKGLRFYNYINERKDSEKVFEDNLVKG